MCFLCVLCGSKHLGIEKKRKHKGFYWVTRITRSRLEKKKHKHLQKPLKKGGFNPFEKYQSNWESSPNRGESKKCLKPPPSDSFHNASQNLGLKSIRRFG